MSSIDRPPTTVGATIPANTPHAVSVTLPSWEANVAYEEGQEWVFKAMRSGYPRYGLLGLCEEFQGLLC